MSREVHKIWGHTTLFIKKPLQFDYIDTLLILIGKKRDGSGMIKIGNID